MTHQLKCTPNFFQALLECRKTFEVRKNDRGFKWGDELHVREYDQATSLDHITGRNPYTGRELRRTISYILSHEDFPEGIRKDYVVIGFAVPYYQIDDARVTRIKEWAGKFLSRPSLSHAPVCKRDLKELLAAL